MDKAELLTTHDIVLEVLRKSPITRSSDNHLFYFVYKTVGHRKGIDIESMPMPRFFYCMKEYGFPSFETIRRTRQKIQADHPELCASKEAKLHRTMNEEVFKEYARGE